MCPRRFLLVCVLGLLPLSGTHAGPPGTAGKDPQAVQILTQCVSTLGGAAAIAGVEDSTATGTITYSWAGESVQASVTLRGKGLSEFRLDAGLSDGTRTWAVNKHGVGVLIAPDGKRRALPLYNLMTAGSLSFPAGRVLDALTNPSTAITFVGLVSSDVGQADQVHVVPSVDATLSDALAGVGAFDLYIDPNTFQLLEVAEKVWSETNAAQTFSHEIIFANYTSVSGVLVPYAISEKIQGQQTWSVAITSVTFNSGLDDSIFSP